MYLKSRLEDEVSPHFQPAPFHVEARPLLQAYPFVPKGICLNPSCSRPFNPTRDWQVYCSQACKTADRTEMQRIGRLTAPALLAWRMGKHESVRTPEGNIPVSPELRALSNAGRAYVTRVQSGWLYDRIARAVESKGG